MKENNGYLLLVEDEPIVQANNRKILERRGYAVRQAYTLAEAWEMVNGEEAPGAIVLDIQLPDGSGLDFLHGLRKNSNIPVLILTAMGTPQDIVRGLEAGGDDYLPKPYELSVFLMRIQALLRRASLVPDTLEAGPIRIDTASSKAYVKGEDLGLQQKELSLLIQFVQRPGEVMGAECLYEKVWGQKMARDTGALKVAVSKLRSKLEGTGYTIVASRSQGYSFEEE